MLRLAAALACFALPATAFPVERCINLGAAMEAPTEGDWGYIIQQRHIVAIAEAGFDTIRLPVRFSAHWHDEQLSPDILARTDQVIAWAEAAGLTTILDLHHFTEFADTPAPHIPTLIKIWDALSLHYADAPDTLIFELFNEPSEAFTTAIAQPVLAQITARLRIRHPDRWIITGGGDWNSLDEMLQMPVPGAHDVRTFHYYVPWEFTHQQAAYMDHPPPPSEWGNAQDRAMLAADMARAGAAEGPVFLGEFGVYRAADQASRHAWIRAVREAAEANGIPWCYWGFTQGDQVGFSAYNTGVDAWEPGLPATLLD